MKVEYTSSPTAEQLDFLTEKINQETPEFGDARPFAFFMKNQAEERVAGCNGSLVFEVIYVDQLWVAKQYRHQGVGKQLMEEVHAYGRRHGCRLATVATMSFQQGLPFYQKLGYQVDFKREGYAQGSFCIFLKKVL